MIIELIRDEMTPVATLGKMFVDGKYLGVTLEDVDRFLEDGGEKIPKQTAIPRGRYRVGITFSHRFKRPMPEVFDVPQFTGVRIHGGNTEDDTEGCPLLGMVRKECSISDCFAINQRLIHLIDAAQDGGDEVWLEVK